MILPEVAQGVEIGAEEAVPAHGEALAADTEEEPLGDLGVGAAELVDDDGGGVDAAVGEIRDEGERTGG